MGIVRYMAKEMIKEIDNKSREFYEFVLPPVDMFYDDESITVVMDMPGFDKDKIKLSLKGSILSIKAEREKGSEGGIIVCNQRPSRIDKKMRIPVQIKEGEEEVKSARYENGVLTVVIPTKAFGKQISIE